jgi:(p)ppGpp synthase/HD superfamily hydrolase
VTIGRTAPELKPRPGYSAAMLGERFKQAMAYALDVHADHLRKSSSEDGGRPVPYVAHLLGVTSIVLEDHGNEDEAIAAMLHDAVEDRGGLERLNDIRDRFGPTVAEIVEGCSDVIPEPGAPKPPWLPRKTAYIRHLREFDGQTAGSIARVSMADKLYNLRATVSDAQTAADPAQFWGLFRTGAAGQLAYYRALVTVYRERGTQSPILRELERLIDELEELMTEDEIRKSRVYEAALLAPDEQ